MTTFDPFRCISIYFINMSFSNRSLFIFNILKLVSKSQLLNFY